MSYSLKSAFAESFEASLLEGKSKGVKFALCRFPGPGRHPVAVRTKIWVFASSKAAFAGKVGNIDDADGMEGSILRGGLLLLRRRCIGFVQRSAE
jgi:hypothetical protein